MLDRTQRRILGVLLEKELAVPDSYPMTANALLAGCNQKNNREPEMSLEPFEIDGALLAMQLAGWAIKKEGGRTPHYRHDVAQKLGVDGREKAVLAELLLRGPQAPGALKTRVVRMGFDGSVEDVVAVLHALRDRPSPLVRELPRAPRERDARWTHLLAPEDELPTADEAPAPLRAAPPSGPGLAERVARLEEEVAALRAELHALRGGAAHGQ